MFRSNITVKLYIDSPVSSAVESYYCSNTFVNEETKRRENVRFERKEKVYSNTDANTDTEKYIFTEEYKDLKKVSVGFLSLLGIFYISKRYVNEDIFCMIK